VNKEKGPESKKPHGFQKRELKGREKKEKRKKTAADRGKE